VPDHDLPLRDGRLSPLGAGLGAAVGALAASVALSPGLPGAVGAGLGGGLGSLAGMHLEYRRAESAVLEGHGGE